MGMALLEDLMSERASLPSLDQSSRDDRFVRDILFIAKMPYSRDKYIHQYTEVLTEGERVALRHILRRTFGYPEIARGAALRALAMGQVSQQSPLRRVLGRTVSPRVLFVVGLIAKRLLFMDAY